MTGVAGRGGREAALSLYRALLRAHATHLPLEMRQLGDAYVKAEFRQLKTVTKSSHLEQFFNEWNSYLEQIRSAGNARAAISGKNDANVAEKDLPFSLGRDLPMDVQLTEEQLRQLEKLKEEATKAGNRKSV